MNITFSRFAVPKTGALVVTSFDDAILDGPAKALDADLEGTIGRAMRANTFKGKRGEIVDILTPHGLDLTRVILLGLGPADKLDRVVAEAAGGSLAAHLIKVGEKAVTIGIDDGADMALPPGELAAHLAVGMRLRNYRFDKYHSKSKQDKEPPKLVKVTVGTDDMALARKVFKSEDAVAEGTMLARDLVSEPPNVLYPKEFAKRCQALSKLGVEVEVLNEKEMRKQGLSALLSVGQGSDHESHLVVMTWDGIGKAGSKTKRTGRPVAFVGKGVCFDSGGISIKPGLGMEEMKGDMGGAAAVAGVMQALAARKAKVYAVGIVGLVENMPDGKALKPGDIITSLSGQTIEIVNTDAEGRLVLADALWYTQARFKPKVMVDMATLTGATMHTFGQDYAGLFTPDTQLAEQLIEAGQATGEWVWRQPIGEAYAKMIESQFADIKNSAGPRGGASTAAEFLHRFVNGTTWAHIDIASTAWRTAPTETSPAWATGYGVRLLDKFVQLHFER